MRSTTRPAPALLASSERTVRSSLVAAILTLRPRCGFSGLGGADGPGSSTAPTWLAGCDAERLKRPRLLGGALARLLARYVAAADPEAERCLEQARADAAEYGLLAAEMGLSPATAVEAFCICRAPILEAAERWATESAAPGRNTTAELSRVHRFFDETLLSMLTACERASAGNA